MTRAEQPGQPDDFTTALAADSRERAVSALLRVPTLRKLWTAHATGAVGDRLGLLALLALTAQAAASEQVLGGGFRGIGFAIAIVFGLRLLAAVLFGAVLLGPLSTLTSPQGVLDRRWTMIGSDAARLALFVVAPLWIDWLPGNALTWLFVTVFVTGLAERLWTIAKDGAAPALLPAQTATGVRPGPDHLEALRRLDLRTGFVALPVAAAGLVAAALLNSLLGVWSVWFAAHQVAMVSYVAAGLFAACVAVLYFIELPDVVTPRPRSPLEGLRRPKGPAGAESGRTNALPTLVLACAAVAGAIAAATSVAVLHATALGGGPTAFGLLVLALTGGTVWGIRTAGSLLPGLSRRRLMGLAIAVSGIALLLTGLVPDPTTVLLLSLLAGYAAGVAANTGHVLIDQEAEEARRGRTTAHLHAVVRLALAVAAVAGPLVAAAIGPHRVVNGSFTFSHGGAAFTLMLVGALLLPVAALVIGKLDDRQGVPIRRDLREALRGGEPAVGPAATGFFLAVEGGDGAGKSTQAEALAEWIRAKGHEVVVTREPGATALGKRLRSILLDVSSTGISDRAEALLYAADRAEHVDSVVRPALERGAIVITDRYIDSSVAYQGAGRDLAPTEIARISRWATGGLVPHLTVLLDIAPDAARERFTEAPDRLESEPAEFHDRVRRGFLTLAAADPSRYLVLDAAQEPETVTRLARHRLDQVLPLSEQEIEARAEAERRAVEEIRKRAEEEAAAKAEAERLEQERQEQLARLRAEEQEQRRLAEEQREREEAERQAEQQAEQARQRAEEARLRAEEEQRLAAEERARRDAAEAARAEEQRRLAEEGRLRQEAADAARADEARRLAADERARRDAEQAARAEEQERLRRQKAEQDRLRAEAQAVRLDKQRKSEEALLRAERGREESRPAAEPGTRTDAGPAADSPSDTPSDAVPDTTDTPESPGNTSRNASTGRFDDATTTINVVPPVPGNAETRTIETPQPQTPGEPTDAVPRRHDDVTRTLETPRPDSTMTVQTPQVPQAPSDNTRTVEVPQPSDAEKTTVMPRVPAADPRVQPHDAERTTVMPRITEDGTPAAHDDAPADRVPSWLFRDEEGHTAGAGYGYGSVSATAPDAPVDDRTRELPQIADADSSGTPRKRPRPSWAEETPLDDLPSLADELLGPHHSLDDYEPYDRDNRDDTDPGKGGGGRRRRR
ncbi:dTMP kinase [Streptomyces sp. SL13]|uniref:Thymidylate kinase n=1 Tax=Streptantibioticus silvisoli TaxID=2705255 RepID=A0AA90H8A9_9ACTN|nr:dTMP kinase [Streptantibioticus silvisoli]MDI5969757.1 dTMP kinase [Streptantibioticus silvisoli]